MSTPPTKGIRHVALTVRRFEETEAFYVGAVGMRVEWRPDPDNVYLTSGTDNLALHRFAPASEADGQAFDRPGHLDHVGFLLARPEDVDAWAAHLASQGIRLENGPKTHRDGARSFYVKDPDGNALQFIHHPPIAGT